MPTSTVIAALCLVAAAGADLPERPVATGQPAPAQPPATPPLEPPTVMGGGRGLGGGPGRSLAFYSGAYAPSTLLDTAQVTAPLRLGDRDALALSVSFGLLHFLDDVAVPGGGGRAMPSDVYEVGLGAAYARRLDGDRTFGARVQIGSPSDEPFSSWSVIAYRAGIEYSFPGGEHGRWVLGLMSANNTAIAEYVPIPGVAYLYRNDDFAAAIGLPVASVQWWPGRWTLSGLLSPRSFEAETAYGRRRGLQGFARFAAGGGQTYLLAHRPDTSQRLFLDEQRVAAGLRFPLVASLAAELQGGYAYSRDLYQADKAALVFAGPDDPKTHLRSGWFAGWTVRLAY
jgi:hypothetical protein